MPYPNQHAARVRNPDLFVKDSIRGKVIAPGITILLGKLKTQGDSGAMTLQSYHFAADKFTPDEAKSWLEAHKVKAILFEPAVKESEESEAFLPLLYQRRMKESAGGILEQTGPEGKTWRVVLIKAGMSENKHYYGVECLQDALPLFENVKAYTYDTNGEYDHVWGGPPNTIPRAIVGFYENITWDEVLEAITADFHVTASWLQDLLREAWKAGKKDILGFSIDGMMGENIDAIRDGQHCLEVLHLTDIAEVTVVTDPAAGGKFLRMVASKQKNKEGGTKMLETLIARLKSMKVITEDADTSAMTVEEAMAKFEEAIRASAGSKEAPKVAATEAMSALLEEIKKELAASQKLREEQIAATAKSEEAAKVQESNNRLEAFLSTDTAMPIPSKERVRESLKGKVYSEEEMNATIKAEKDYVGRLTESGVKSLGDQRADIGAGDEQADKFQIMLDDVFGLEPKDEKHKRIRESLGHIPKSLRRAYATITDDPEVTGFYGGAPGKVQRLTEAISTSFPYLLANTLNRRLLADFNAAAEYPWQDWFDVIDLTDLKEVQPVRMGGINILRTYTESNDDNNIIELGMPGDEKAAWSPETKIGIVRLSRKAIINDDLRAFLGNVARMGRSGQRTLVQEIFNAILNVSAGVINAGTAYDSVALYVAAHQNIQTTAFSYAALWALRNLLTRQFSTGYESALGAAMNDTFTETVTMATGTGKNFPVGTTWQVDSEKLYVKVQSTDTLTCTRGILGTTAATHSNSAVTTIIIEQVNNQLGWLLVPAGTALEQQAQVYATSEKVPDGAQNDKNPLFGKFIPIAVDPILLLGDQTNYYGIGKGGGVKGGEVGFYGGHAPTLIIQDQPPMGQVFAGENIRLKERFEFGVKVTNYRPFAAGIVAG